MAVAAVDPVELLLFVLLAVKGADHADAGEILLQDAGQAPFRLIHPLEGGPYPPEEDDGVDHDSRHQEERDERHADVESDHERDRGRQHDDGPPDLHDLGGQKAAEGLHIRCTALDEIAGLGPVVEAAGQMLELIVEPIAELSHDLLARGGGPAAAEIGEETGNGREGHHADQGQPEIGAQELRTAETVHHPSDEGRCLLGLR